MQTTNKWIIISLSVFCLALFGLSAKHANAGTVEETFDTYTIGNLNGQGSWTVNGGEATATTSEAVTLFNSGAFRTTSGNGIAVNTDFSGSYATTTYTRFRMKMTEPIATSTNSFIGF